MIVGLILGALLWWLYYGLEIWINGGQYVSECFLEELHWFLPGGRKLKGEYIKKLMRNFKEGYIGNFKYSQIREYNLYEQVGQDVLPGRLHFIFTHIFIPLIPNIVIFGLILPIIRKWL